MPTLAINPSQSVAPSASSSDMAMALPVPTKAVSQPLLDQPRKKIWAPRTRAGCLVCRKRRIKCDETKPACLRCVTAQKECVYFRSTSPASAIARSLFPAPVLGTVPELTLSRFFVGHVIVFLADEFNGDLWRHLLPQVLHNVEPIWHASNAIASLALSHRGANEGGASAKESTRQYSMSMKYILEITQTPAITPKNKVIVMLANILYGIYALFTGDADANMVLHEKTRRLIRHWKFWECTECASISTLSFQLLHHFLKSSTLRQETLLLSPEKPRLTWLEAVAWFQKRPMASILQTYVEFEMIWISLRATLDNLPFRPTKTDILVASAHRTVLRNHFESWSQRYQVLQSTLPLDSLHASILKIRTVLANILMKLDLTRSERLWDETCWDAFDSEFSKAFDLLEVALGKENAETHKDRFDTQLTPSLYKALNFIARACRRPVLRRKAIALLRHSLTVARGRVSNVSGNPSMEFVADNIIEMEERAWNERHAASDCHALLPCVEDEFICSMHRVSRVISQGGFAQRTTKYTILTTGDRLWGRPGKQEMVNCVFFS